MLAVLQFPLTDVRAFLEEDTHCCQSPSWPVVSFPEEKQRAAFIRGFGQTAERQRGGLDEWRAEESFCDISHAVRLEKVALQDHPLRQSRRLRAYCSFRRMFWDGRLKEFGRNTQPASVVGRAEVGFGIKPSSNAPVALDAKELVEVIDALLGQRAYLLSRKALLGQVPAKDGYFELANAGSKVATAYLRASTRTSSLAAVESKSWWLSAGSSMLIIEYYPESEIVAPPRRARALPSPELEEAGVRVFLFKHEFQHRQRPVWLIERSPSYFDREAVRRLRLNLVRLHTEIAGLKVIERLVSGGKVNPSRDSEADKYFQHYLEQSTAFLLKDYYQGVPQREFMRAAFSLLDSVTPGELKTLNNVLQGIRPNTRKRFNTMAERMLQEWDWDFFIAHAGPDKELAEQLYDLLAPSARVFLDSRCLKLGDNWDEALGSAQDRALVTVVLVTDKTEDAYYEREEIANAIKLARSAPNAHRVVPLVLNTSPASPVKVPYGLRLKHGLSIAAPQELANAATQLISLLQSLGVKPAAGGVPS